VDVAIDDSKVTVKGANGTLQQPLNPLVKITRDGAALKVVATTDSAAADAMSGTMRALLANMITGTGKGFEKKLNLVGVGFRAQAQGSKLNLQVGFSHPVAVEMPAGVKVECPTQTEIVLKGADRQAVGQIAAEVRAVRPPEPYKGKGIRYANERVVLKETKKK
jgi:large subunit ribosomal protein L6